MRIRFEDERIADAARHRAADLQEIAREEAVAVAEYQRLLEANRAGTLNREERTSDGDGVVTIEKARDTARLQAASDAVDAIREKRAAVAPASTAPRMSAARIERELAKIKGVMVEIDRPTVDLGKSEKMTDALTRLRKERLALITERKEIDRASRTTDEVKAAMTSAVDELAAKLPRTLPMFHGAPVAWPQHEIRTAKARVPDALAVIAFLFGDKLKAELSKLIDFNAGAFPDAMSREERAERLAELDSEIETAERLEAAAVEQVIAEGGTAYHRPDTDVLAILSLRVAE
jgi:hypothetical protein